MHENGTHGLRGEKQQEHLCDRRPQICSTARPSLLQNHHEWKLWNHRKVLDHKPIKMSLCTHSQNLKFPERFKAWVTLVGGKLETEGKSSRGILEELPVAPNEENSQLSRSSGLFPTMTEESLYSSKYGNQSHDKLQSSQMSSSVDSQYIPYVEDIIREHNYSSCSRSKRTHLHKLLIYQKVYAADKCYGELRLLNKLTEEHIDPEKNNKMRVKLATQVFSHSIAVVAEHLTARGDLQEECRQLVNITLLIDDLFDSLNINTLNIPNGKIYKGPVKRISPITSYGLEQENFA
ncbi:unnamed protein product [Diatraea saccharalis]|uniref:Transposable element P transposase-like GTP-binding insertion domain-containing protein n=1 Tax=Diatraea saccharalis TaxID=40085 RepID=A0A9N9R2R5_9NEOP|nr:unnamed protein product [Diatraea saccharalis]